MRCLALLALCVATSALAAPRVEFVGFAELLAPDVASTASTEIRPALSPDGHTLLWGTTNRADGVGGWDVWMARRTADGWSKAVAVAFDTPHKEFDPAFAPDGRAVWFFSDRPGGRGGDDIYVVAFDPDDATFGRARNAGAAINSAGDEWAPTPTPDGRGLLFASDGRGGAGQHDLFVARRRFGGWARAVALPGDVNGMQDDFDAAYLGDGETLVFARSADAASKPITLWIATREGERYAEPRPLPDSVNVADGWTLGPATSAAEPDMLYFTSHRADARRGGLDLYRIRYRITPESAVVQPAGGL